jgi:hypothetical protein
MARAARRRSTRPTSPVHPGEAVPGGVLLHAATELVHETHAFLAEHQWRGHIEMATLQVQIRPAI